MSRRRERGRFICAGSLFLLLAAMPSASALAQPQELKREIFLPAQGRGSIVVVVSGASGPQPYRDFGSKLAESGYYTVLMDGNDVFDLYNARSDRGQLNLKKVIAESQSATQALPGKVALLGFSIGGAGVLFQGAPMDEQVSAVCCLLSRDQSATHGGVGACGRIAFTHTRARCREGRAEQLLQDRVDAGVSCSAEGGALRIRCLSLCRSWVQSPP
jgi:hypothetical protein